MRASTTALIGGLTLIGLDGCARAGRCCDEPNCVGQGTSGSEVLRFRGDVPRNVLFVSIDTLRRDHLGAYGNKAGLTPFLDEIAGQGVVVRDHHQCSNWTMDSTTCTLAGRTHVERGHLPRLTSPESARTPVPRGTPFLATWLGEAGYVSAIATTNSWLSSAWGNTQGYDAEPDAEGGGANGFFAVKKALSDLSGGGRDPWFGHVHLMEPHASYDPPDGNVEPVPNLEPWPEDLRKRPTHYDWRDAWPGLDPRDQGQLEANLRQLYEGEVRTVDDEIEHAWKRLEAECWLDDTLVVIWSDHGEAFWEHGYQTHAWNLTGEENDGILIFWAKNLIPGEWNEPTWATDLVPTILDLHGIPIPDEVSGLPLGTAPRDRAIVTGALARLRGVQAVTRNGKKLHYNWANGSLRLWDRNADPHETDDLFDPTDPEAQELWSILAPQVEAMAALVEGGNPAPTWPADLPRP